MVAYTPLYYALAAAVRWAFGPGFLPGRLLSLLAGGVIIVLVGYLTTRVVRDWWAGLFAAALFCAFGLPGMPWVVLFRVDTLGVALSIAAIATLAHGTGRGHVVASSVLCSLAFLTKQTLIGAGLAATIWLWQRDRKQAVLFVAVAGSIVASTGVAEELTTRAFVANTVTANVNPFSWSVAVDNATTYLTHQAGPLLLALWFIGSRLRTPLHPVERLLMIFWASTLPPLVGLAKVGSNHNYWLEVAAVTAVLATWTCWAALRAYRKRLAAQPLMLALGLIGLTLAMTALPTARVAVYSARRALAAPADVAAFQRVVERVRQDERDVLAFPMDVLTASDRRLIFEPYIYSIFYSEGRWDPTPLVRRVCTGEIGLLVTNEPLEAEPTLLWGYAFWPTPLLAVLREAMVYEFTSGGRFVYAARPDLGRPDAAVSPVCRPFRA